MKTCILIVVSLLMIFHPAWSKINLGNSTWVYDATYDIHGNRKGIAPGLYALNIKNYNAIAPIKHRITQVFSYGGFLKMFCLGSGGSEPSTACTEDKLYVVYNIDSTIAYDKTLNATRKAVDLLPVVDGVLSGKFLTAFNTMDAATAARFADKVAGIYCADNRIAGIQFDLEPFDMTQRGQEYFFRQIAKDLAGKNAPSGTDPLQCVNASHPNGRVFSIFTTARKLNEKVGSILNEYQNGYIIGALYTLGPVSETANSPSLYAWYVNNEVKRMIKIAGQYQIKYQFAIPVSATLEEFETNGGVASGYRQVNYVKIAIDAIDLYARTDVNFRGIDLWAWSVRRFLRDKEYTPSIPPSGVMQYLATRL